VWFFQAVALDLDGTLADGDQLAETAMAAIKASRGELRMILVTGRVFSDLEAAFPGLRGELDAVVTENGAVLSTRSGTRPLAAPLDPAVERALAERGVASRPGQVLLALTNRLRASKPGPFRSATWSLGSALKSRSHGPEQGLTPSAASRHRPWTATSTNACAPPDAAHACPNGCHVPGCSCSRPRCAPSAEGAG
jgi:haloacid dehalogenase-like hydrolase